LIIQSILAAWLICLSVSVDAANQPAIVSLKGKVTAVSGENITINLGNEHGVKPKMTFEIYGKGEVVVIPFTGETLFSREKIIGKLTIIKIDDESASGRFDPIPGSITLPQPGAWAMSNMVSVDKNQPPVINKLSSSATSGATGIAIQLTADALDVESDPITFHWNATGGRLAFAKTLIPENTWYPPLKAGNYEVKLIVSDRHSQGSKVTVRLKSSGPGADRGRKPLKLKRTYILDPSGAGLFRVPGSLTFDRRGRMYVLDTGSSSIRVFSQNLTLAKTLKLPDLSSNVKIEIHSERLYVVDGSKGEIRGYDLAGKQLVKFGERGTENGQLRKPADIAVNKAGEIFVVDPDRVDVQLFNSKGQFILRLGKKGIGNGTFEKPTSVACDHDDNLYVLDGGKGYVHVFGPDLRFLSKFPLDNKEKGFSEMGMDRDRGVLYVLGESNYIHIYDLKGTAKGRFGGDGESLGQFKQGSGLVVSPSGTIYLCDTAERFIQRFSVNGAFAGKWGGQAFDRISCIAASEDGTLYLMDNRKSEVVCVDHYGWTLSRFGGSGRKKGQFDEPIDVGVDKEGNVYVLDADRNLVQKFSSTGKYLAKFGSTDRGPAHIDQPQDMSVIASNIYVVNWQRENSVSVFGMDGKAKNAPPHEFGDIYTPFGIAANTSGSVFVYSKSNRTIQYFDASASAGNIFEKKKQFSLVSDMEFNAMGQLFICDESRRDIQVFSYTGGSMEYLQVIKDKKIERPSDIATDAYGNLYVLDENSRKIHQLN